MVPDFTEIPLWWGLKTFGQHVADAVKEITGVMRGDSHRERPVGDSLDH